MLHRVSRYILQRFYKPVAAHYLKKERYWNYKGIQLKILPGVFHPRFFFSTKLMIQFLSSLKLENKRILELGAGSALVALWCEKQKAKVTASDINKTAIENIELNKKLNNSGITVIHSDLFNSIPLQHFDYIIINPPYYKKTPVTDAQYAWYCGENGEYFNKLFSTIGGYLNTDSKIIMVLSEDCDIEMIQKKAAANNFSFTESLRKTIMFETNYIFTIQ